MGALDRAQRPPQRGGMPAGPVRNLGAQEWSSRPLRIFCALNFITQARGEPPRRNGSHYVPLPLGFPRVASLPFGLHFLLFFRVQKTMPRNAVLSRRGPLADPGARFARAWRAEKGAGARAGAAAAAAFRRALRRPAAVGRGSGQRVLNGVAAPSRVPDPPDPALAREP